MPNGTDKLAHLNSGSLHFSFFIDDTAWYLHQLGELVKLTQTIGANLFSRPLIWPSIEIPIVLFLVEPDAILMCSHRPGVDSRQVEKHLVSGMNFRSSLGF